MQCAGGYSVESEGRKLDGAAMKRWLTDDVTVTLPGWALAAGGLLCLVILLVALD